MDENRVIPAVEFITDKERQLPPDTRTLTADMARVALHADAAAQTPAGEPLLDYTVRSVYDSRPVNTYDFNIPANNAGEGGTDTVVELSFEVPRGSVCVLRAVHHWIEGTPPSLPDRSDVLMTLTINDISQQYNQNIPVGLESDELVKCFLIADEGQQVGVRLVFSAAVTIADVDRKSVV